MSVVPGGGVFLEPTPDGAVRRSTTLTFTPLGSWAAGQQVTLTGRDLARSPGPAAESGTESRSESTGVEIVFEIDAAGLLRASAADAEACGEGTGLPAELLGTSATRGLRKRLSALHGEIDPDQSGGQFGAVGPVGGLLDAMLDDLVGTGVASGYGRLYEESIGLSEDELGTIDVTAAMQQTCTGFHGLHEHGEVFDVRRYFETKPASVEFVPAPGLATDGDNGDELIWHTDPALPVHGFRRRRLLQVEPRGDGSVAITGYFRDTFRRADGLELVVHEYGVNATASGDQLALDEVSALPGHLPMAYCPMAAGSALTLTGERLEAVEAAVRLELSGPAGCTHLNDELRSLRQVPVLLALLPTGQNRT